MWSRVEREGCVCVLYVQPVKMLSLQCAFDELLLLLQDLSKMVTDDEEDLVKEQRKKEYLWKMHLYLQKY